MKFGILLIATSLLLTGCGVKEEMSQKMDDSLDQIKKTNEIVKQQCVALTFEGLVKPEFGQDLAPIAFDIMPFAKKFGECTSSEDITEVLYLWTKKLNETTIEFDSPTPEQSKAYAKHKAHIFSAMQAVAGLLSQAKIDQIIAAQIDGDGRFQDTALEILMLRASFIRDVLLGASLLAKDLNTVGKIQKAIEYADLVERIERLPYANLIQFNASGLAEPAKFELEKGTSAKIWLNIRQRANGCYANRVDVKPGEKPLEEMCPSHVVTKAKLTLARKAQVAQSLHYINSKIKAWGEELPAISGIEALP